MGPQLKSTRVHDMWGPSPIFLFLFYFSFSSLILFLSPLFLSLSPGLLLPPDRTPWAATRARAGGCRRQGRRGREAKRDRRPPGDLPAAEGGGAAACSAASAVALAPRRGPAWRASGGGGSEQGVGARGSREVGGPSACASWEGGGPRRLVHGEAP